MSSRPSDKQWRKLNDRILCWVDSKVWCAGVGWWNADDDEKRAQRMEWDKVPRCLTMQTAVCHDTQLICDSLWWYTEPMEFIVQKCQQTTIKLPSAADHAGSSVEQHSLQLTGDRLRRSMRRLCCNSQRVTSRKHAQCCRWLVAVFGLLHQHASTRFTVLGSF